MSESRRRLNDALANPDRCRVWTANHRSENDALILRTLTRMHTIGYDFYKDMCWLKVSPLNFLDPIYVPQKSRTEGNGAARDAVRLAVKDALSKGSEPVMVFPEGGLTGGRARPSLTAASPSVIQNGCPTWPANDVVS